MTNFFGNLEDVGTGLNNLLQGKLVDGAADVGRFAVNSVVGIVGLWDVATPMGLEKHDEDFGQTLGWWGVPPGPVLRDSVPGAATRARRAGARGRPVAGTTTAAIDNIALVLEPATGSTWCARARSLLKAERVLDEAALDKYTFTRDAWLQRRRNQVYDGHPPPEKEEE